MINLKTYRIVTFILLAVFLLFNVGLPIVLASCPMIQDKHVASSCCAQKKDGLQTIKPNKDYSCCKTVIAAERNTNEFVQCKNCVANFDYSITPLFQSIDYSNSQIYLISTYISSPPSEDIPIFTSSLLI